MTSGKILGAGKSICKQNNPHPKDEGVYKNMKRFADEQESVAGVPLVLEPVVVEDAPVGIAVQHRDVPAVTVQRGRAVLFVSRAIRITTD